MRRRRLLATAALASLIVAGVSVAPASAAGAATTVLVGRGSTWSVNDRGVDLGVAWRTPSFDSSAWPSGNSQIGYGDGDEVTRVSAFRSTYYMRKSFPVASTAGATGLTLSTVLDDGAVVYLNGTEVWRTNVPAGQSYATLASTAVSGEAEKAWRTVNLPVSALVNGPNLLAVEVHNSATSSSDISFDLELTLQAEVAQVLCRVDDARLPELSGIASSVRHPGIVWVHNDSGDTARVFALDVATCAVRATVTLAGVKAVDFEAISMGRDASGAPELWVGDTGDNSRSRSRVLLHRFPEPTLVDQSVAVKTVAVTWSDGPRDCETLMVEPVANGRVFLASKEAIGGLYQLQGDFRTTGVAITGSRLGPAGATATDGAIAPDRSRTVIRSYSSATMSTGVPGTGPRTFALPPQPQGEAITFTPDSRYMYIASEGSADLVRIPAWGI